MIALQQLLDTFQGAVLATLTPEGHPFCSHAPFVYENDTIYLYLSNIAKHTAHLRNDPHASLLFIDDESHTQNIFARKRITLQCSASEIDSNDPLHPSIMTTFRIRHGDTVEILRELDFCLFGLRPVSGEAVFGFGKTYVLGGIGMNELHPRRNA